jgi:4'-phosphopantetheinyl transferase
MRERLDIPGGEEWLTPDERLVLSKLPTEPRRLAWRLGRWAAKSALAEWLSCAPEEIEVRAGPSGAPEARVKSQLLPVSVSLSHRGDHALAAVAAAGQAVGCDLELIEPRSLAFVREWFAPGEQRLVLSSCESVRPLLANLIWTAKEAATKVRGQGLRLDVRTAVVTLGTAADSADGWRSLRVDWGDGTERTSGWWRWQARWVMSIAAAPPPNPPRRLPHR